MDSNINNVTVRVPLFASVTIKWLFGKPGIQRIVLGISSASQVIGRFQNGEFGCYKDGLLTEMECHRHFSLTVNASSEIIIAITNISDSYFGNYIVSIYRGPDDKIDTLWIKVYKKESLLQDMSSTAWTPTVSLPHMSHTRTEGHVITNTNKCSEQPPTSEGTSNQKKAVIGVTTVAAAAVLIVVIAFLYRKGRDTGTVETVESV